MVGILPFWLGTLSVKAQTSSPQVFLPGSDGIPLMADLTPLADTFTQIGDAQGRLIDFSTKGDVTSQALFAYYDIALPNLGWKKQAPGLYQRQADQLQIFFDAGASQGENLIKFQLILSTPQ